MLKMDITQEVFYINFERILATIFYVLGRLDCDQCIFRGEGPCASTTRFVR